MGQRLNAGLQYVGVLGQVPRRVEVEIRPPTLSISVLEEMLQRRNIGLGDVRVLQQVKPLIEQAAPEYDIELVSSLQGNGTVRLAKVANLPVSVAR